MILIENSLVENIHIFTPENITKELIYINKIYEKYNKELILFLKSLDDVLQDLNELYKDVYFTCMEKHNGLNSFNSYGYVIIKVVKYINTLKTQWSLYQRKFQIFLNKLKSNTTQFMVISSL